MYKILKGLKDRTKTNGKGIRNYQNLQAGVYKGSNRTSGNEKNTIYETKNSMDIQDKIKNQ